MAEDRKDINPKSVIKVGSYHVGRTIGKGNFAVVKLAEHVTAKYKVAIKMIDKIQLDDVNLSKVQREVRIMKSINHLNMIRLYEVMETERYLYLVMEYASKGEIFDLLIKQGRLNEKEARIMFRQIISAVEYLHQKRIVHRDLKAENLLLDENNHMKLIDFGFSNNFELGAKLKTWCGSPPYAAPEMFEGKEYYGPATDIWSMGVVLYVLVCGAMPFDARTLHDLKQTVLAGKFRIPYFMSEDCESLLRHMLVVDPNKRYTMNQIKLHKWIIQGEPYQFLIDEDEFCHAQHHSYGENGTSVVNEHVLEQIDKLGINKNTVIECLQKKAFDQTYGLYHILLDKHLKAQRNQARLNKRDVCESERLNITPRSESPLIEVDNNKTVSYGSSVSSSEEKNEPTAEELEKYFSNSKRRETIAVSHLTPDYKPTRLFCDNYNIPEISIFRSPTPPFLELTNQLQYKEQYLPRPAVLQVRPQFDRRASDGSATLQDSIARFNLQKSMGNSTHYSGAAGQEENGANVLGIPETENGGSESDNEPDPEAVQRYLMSRGSKQRHTFNCIREAAPEEQDTVVGSYNKAAQSSKARNNIKLSNRDRERASPVPYLPLSPVPYLPVSPESRRSVTSNDRRPSADSGLSVHLYQDKRKDDQDLTIKQVLVEHNKLRDQYPSNTNDHNVRSSRRGSQNTNSNLFMHSFPVFPDGTPSADTPSILPPLEPDLSDHNLLLLHQKQEAQRKNLYVQHVVQRRFLEKQMEAERRELIRRASEGAMKLESGVADFLKNRKERSDFHKTETVNPASPVADEQGIPPAGGTELQDEMKKLNIQINDSLFEERQRSNTNPTSHDSPFTPPLGHCPGSMDVDDEAIGDDIQTNYRYANVQTLFNNPAIGSSRTRPRRGNFLPVSPRFGLSMPGLTFTPYVSNDHNLDANSPIAPGNGDRLLWTGTDNENNEHISSQIENENPHESLNRTSSVDITSSLDITQVVDEVKRCLDERPDIDYSQSDSFFSLYKEGIQLEIEVCPLTKLGQNGVKVRRVGGDKWEYKKLRDDLLSGLYL